MDEEIEEVEESEESNEEPIVEESEESNEEPTTEESTDSNTTEANDNADKDSNAQEVVPADYNLDYFDEPISNADTKLESDIAAIGGNTSDKLSMGSMNDTNTTELLLEGKGKESTEPTEEGGIVHSYTPEENLLDKIYSENLAPETILQYYEHRADIPEFAVPMAISDAIKSGRTELARELLQYEDSDRDRRIDENAINAWEELRREQSEQDAVQAEQNSANGGEEPTETTDYKSNSGDIGMVANGYTASRKNKATDEGDWNNGLSKQANNVVSDWCKKVILYTPYVRNATKRF